MGVKTTCRVDVCVSIFNMYSSYYFSTSMQKIYYCRSLIKTFNIIHLQNECTKDSFIHVCLKRFVKFIISLLQCKKPGYAIPQKHQKIQNSLIQMCVEVNKQILYMYLKPNNYILNHVKSMEAYFCHHLSVNYIDLSDLGFNFSGAYFRFYHVSFHNMHYH